MPEIDEISSTDLDAISDDVDNQPGDDTEVVEAEDNQPEEEVETDETTEETSENEKPEVKEDEEEWTDDFSEWAEQFELPDGIDSHETLAQSYKESVAQMKRGQSAADQFTKVEDALRQRGLSVNDVMTGNFPTKPQPAPSPDIQTGAQGGESYFNSSAMSGVVEEMVKDGRLVNSDSSPQTVETYRGLGKMIDGAYGKQFKRAEQVYTTAMGAIVGLQKQVRTLSWDKLDKGVRDAVNRPDADKLLDAGLDGMSTYEDVIQFLSFKNPDLLKNVAKKAEERGKDKGRKKVKRFKTMRRNKKPVATSKKWSYEKYLNPNGNWDQDLMASLSIDDQAEMLDAFEKENYSKK